MSQKVAEMLQKSESDHDIGWGSENQALVLVDEPMLTSGIPSPTEKRVEKQIEDKHLKHVIKDNGLVEKKSEA